MKPLPGAVQTLQHSPEIDPELDRFLEADILARGVFVPIVVDRHVKIIDGGLRHEIAGTHDLGCPRILVYPWMTNRVE